MIKLNQAVIVEGKYDKIRLESLLDATIIQTDGFSIFKDKEKQRLIRRLAEKNGILILTDSDSAGFKIRSFLSGSINQGKGKVLHAYIPDVFGKEKRKDAPSKEGKLGVEGMRTQALVDALSKAGVLYEEVAQPSKKVEMIDLFEDGLSGGENSQAKKAAVLRYLDLPERLSTSSFLQLINTFMTYDEYKSAVEACRKEWENG
ncbi:MAG: DUF4093 domain-containing protein [Clostridia bacterium]|nr:DUF4093 domain-containing protein [Clostridia bacterium]